MSDEDGTTATSAPEATAPTAAPRGPQSRGLAAGAPPPAQLGRYELLFELARGGMGTVHVGRLVGAHGFDRLVAIKLLSDSQRGDAELASFLKEARITARITHPNVVQTLELGEEDGVPFIVMELVRGVSMSQLLRELRARKEPLDPEVAAWIVAKAAAGLEAAHNLEDDEGEPLGLVHRDVSPQNLLLSYEGRVAVADFGIAKLVDNDPTRSGIVKGKFAYMSPEQAMARPVDRRSDVFALGVVLHEALTGRRLFATSSPLETVRAIVDSNPSPPSSRRADVPEALDAITMRALSKAIDARYATAAEMSKALMKAVGGHGEVTLAELLQDRFASQRDRFEARLRKALRAAASSPGTPAPSPRPAADDQETTLAETPAKRAPAPAATLDADDDQTVGPTVGLLPERRSRPTAALALALIAAGGAAAYFALSGGTSASEPEATPTAQAAAAQDPGPRPEPSAEPKPEPSPTARPSASAASSATATITRPPPSPVAKAPPAKAPPAKAPPAKAPPAKPAPKPGNPDADKLFTDIPLPK